MKLRDRLGNELREGDSIAWTPQGEMLAHVVKAVAPGATRNQDGSYAPGRVVLQIEFGMPYEDKKDQKDIRLGAFLKTFDPEGEKVVAAVTH